MINNGSVLVGDVVSKPSKDELAEWYQRPSYRAAAPRGSRIRVRDVVFPWRTARRIYGPYRLVKFTAADVAKPVTDAALGTAAAPFANTAAAKVVDPLVERLLTPRALLSLGAVVLIIQLFAGDGPEKMLESAFGGAMVAMIVGPVGLLLVAGSLILLAFHGTRWRVLKLVARPVGTAAATIALFGGFILISQDTWFGQVVRFGSITPTSSTFTELPGTVQIPLIVAAMLFGLWFMIFSACALFLIHRNSFNVRGHPLMRPLASMAVAWLVASTQLTIIGPAPGIARGAWLSGIWAGVLGATGVALVELVRVRRRQRVGFRGPLPERGRSETGVINSVR